MLRGLITARSTRQRRGYLRFRDTKAHATDQLGLTPRQFEQPDEPRDLPPVVRIGQAS